MFGLLNIHKPAGLSSHSVVGHVRRLCPRKTRVGHTGTLDPFATGVLVVGVGPATKLADYVQQQTKRYEAEITLDVTSTTDDPEGVLSREESPGPPPDETTIRQTLRQFVGEIEQVPPAYSAIHIDGQRAYKLARAGKHVEIPSRRVRIDSIELLQYAYPTLTIRVQCGSGTYIRSLARDIGQLVAGGGYCSALCRTAVGEFTTESAVLLDDVDPERDMLPAKLAVPDLPLFELAEERMADLRNGKALALDAVTLDDVALDAVTLDAVSVAEGAEIGLMSEQGELIALARWDADRCVALPKKVFLR